MKSRALPGAHLVSGEFVLWVYWYLCSFSNEQSITVRWAFGSHVLSSHEMSPIERLMKTRVVERKLVSARTISALVSSLVVQSRTMP